MSVDWDDTDLPPESITVDNKTWDREKFDTDGFQWVRRLNEDEYDWDPDADDVTLIGTDVPILVVEMQYRNEKWHVSASETAGPDYHRPGYTELISGEFSFTTTDIEEATETVKEFIDRLS